MKYGELNNVMKNLESSYDEKYKILEEKYR